MKLLSKAATIAAIATTTAAVQGQEDQSLSVSTLDTLVLDPMLVIGSKENVANLPGSGAYLDSSDVRDANFINGNRILNKVPGVYVREEDGYGNFPNISIRGGDGTRNEKVTVMEDGILTAPATYSAPSAYYSPRTARMSAVEVLKGSSQVRFGPHTTGGVINYISTPVPEDHNFYLKAIYGSNNTFQGHTYYGDVIESDAGTLGFVAELFYQSADGYRTIDSGPGFSGSDKTGFAAIEPMFKVYYEPNSATYQRLEFKYGYTDLDADETYLGLTESDYAKNPHRRYAGSFLDNIATQHHRSYLKYLIQPNDDLTVQLAGYYNEFKRNWYKIRKVNGNSLHKVLADPSGSRADYDTLRFRGEGDLGIRDNSRSYRQYGVQLTADWAFSTGNINHNVHLGARYHNDYIRRFQRDSKINVGSNGYTGVSVGPWGSGGNRYQETDAIAVWIEDEISFGALTLRPGIRYEYLDLHNIDYKSDPTNTVTARRNGNLDYIAPGIGFTYDMCDESQLFGGVYKGVSTPGPRSHLKSGVDVEESIGYELGLRYNGANTGFELVGFYTDFSNLTGTDAGFGQEGNAPVNAGEAEVYGIEASISHNLMGPDAAIGLPVYLSGTWTNATLENALSSGGGDDIYAGGAAGATIPYIPEWKVAAGIGVTGEKWGLNLDAIYTSEAFGTAKNLRAPSNSSREGIIDEVLLLDLSAHYQATDNIKILGGVQNVLDESYVVSRIPEGPRSGAPQFWYVGVEMKF